MTDYIKREDAINVFDWGEDLYVRCGIAMQNIKDIPSADVVEVVRCKYCKHGKKKGATWYCRMHKAYMLDDDYCRYGRADT